MATVHCFFNLKYRNESFLPLLRSTSSSFLIPSPFGTNLILNEPMSPFPFFRLPPELRLKVYSFLIVTSPSPPRRGKRIGNYPYLNAGLNLVSRQVREETQTFIESNPGILKCTLQSCATRRAIQQCFLKTPSLFQQTLCGIYFLIDVPRPMPPTACAQAAVLIAHHCLNKQMFPNVNIIKIVFPPETVTEKLQDESGQTRGIDYILENFSETGFIAHSDTSDTEKEIFMALKVYVDQKAKECPGK